MATNGDKKKTAINLHMNVFFIYLCILDMASANATASTTVHTSTVIHEKYEYLSAIKHTLDDLATNRFALPPMYVKPK